MIPDEKLLLQKKSFRFVLVTQSIFFLINFLTHGDGSDPLKKIKYVTHPPVTSTICSKQFSLHCQRSFHHSYGEFHLHNLLMLDYV